MHRRLITFALAVVAVAATALVIPLALSARDTVRAGNLAMADGSIRATKTPILRELISAELAAGRAAEFLAAAPGLQATAAGARLPGGDRRRPGLGAPRPVTNYG